MPLLPWSYLTASLHPVGLAGLALTQILGTAFVLGWAVMNASMLEANMNAVERVHEYSSPDRVPNEAQLLTGAAQVAAHDAAATGSSDVCFRCNAMQALILARRAWRCAYAPARAPPGRRRVRSSSR